ncbi:MAG: hypothetical protein FWD55_06180 [Propionibacteriaceae bacterium]|nr:hypothetical protein [Propionibacteriaceae bacterium]
MTDTTALRKPVFTPEQGPRLAVQMWLASRLVLMITALWVMHTQRFTLTEVFSRWDAVHFIRVAETGYGVLTETAFFPGLPLVMAAFSFVGIPAFVTGIVVSLVGSGLAAWALFRLAGGGQRGVIAVAAWSFAPVAVFTFVPYTEAIFCACAFWAFWYAKRDQWLWASVLAGAGCLFRVSGLFLIGALGLVALFGFGKSTWKRKGQRLVWLVIPALVLFAYSLYLRLAFGSWTTWLDAQYFGWGRHFDWPWNALALTLRIGGLVGPTTSVTAVIFRWEVVALAIGIITTAVLFSEKKVPEGGWVGIQVLALSFQMALISLARCVLLWFPLFLFVSDLGRGRAGPRWNNLRRVLVIILGCVEIIGMVWWAQRFFAGKWAG